MQLVLLLAVVACVSGEMADGPIPTIQLPDSIMKQIPSFLLKPLEYLNDSIEKLNYYLDLDKWSALLSSSGEAGKALLTSLKSFINLFIYGDFTSPGAIGDVANDGYNAIGKIQEAIQKVNDIPLYIPGLSNLNGALTNTKDNLYYIRCLRPSLCIYGRRRRSMEDLDRLVKFEITEEY